MDLMRGVSMKHKLPSPRQAAGNASFRSCTGQCPYMDIQPEAQYANVLPSFDYLSAHALNRTSTVIPVNHVPTHKRYAN
jgi:hypothetical protein